MNSTRKEKKEIGVLLRLPPEVHQRIAVWSSETGRSVHELLLDAVQRAFVSWSGGIEEDAAGERDALREENERLRAKLKEITATKKPVSTMAPKQAYVRRGSVEEQERALQAAQEKLEALRRESQQQRALLERGRVEGVSYEAEDLPRLQQAKDAKRPNHANQALSKSKVLVKATPRPAPPVNPPEKTSPPPVVRQLTPQRKKP